MFSVFLEFCTLMGGNGIFQRKLVQAEFFAQPGDSLAVGGFQLDPEETIGMGNMLADVVKFDRLDFGIVEEQAVDDELRQRWEQLGDSRACSGQLHANSILVRFCPSLRYGRQMAPFAGGLRGGKLHSPTGLWDRK